MSRLQQEGNKSGGPNNREKHGSPIPTVSGPFEVRLRMMADGVDRVMMDDESMADGVVMMDDGLSRLSCFFHCMSA